MDKISSAAPRFIARLALLFLTVTLSTGCDAGTSTAPALSSADLGTVDLASVSADAAASPSVTASITCNADDVVTGTASIVLSGAASFYVEYGADTDYGLVTPTVNDPGDGQVTVPLLGLVPGGTTHLRVQAVSAAGVTADSGDLTVTCPSLPAGMPDFSQVVGATSNDLLLVSVMNVTAQLAFGVLLDKTGRVYWYHPQDYLGDFDRTRDGNFVSIELQRFDEFTLAGTVARTWRDPISSTIDNHEFVSLPNGDAMILGLNDRTVDTTGYVADGRVDATELESTITELAPDGTVISHWNLGDQITLAETTPDIDLTAATIDAHHANSIGILADENLLVSLRHTDTVYKLNRPDGQILWRLGGKLSDFAFVNDPLNGFSHQHYARELSNGNILLFDDGNLHTPPLSRVVEYQVDEAAHTATLAWEYRRPDLVSTCCGSTARLPSGNTVTAWGTTGVIDEADPSGTTVWQMSVPAGLIYRAIPVDRLYP